MERGQGDVGIAPYEIPLALRATFLFKGGLRANNVRPYGGWGLGLEKGKACGKRGGVNLCTENRDSPEGGTGGGFRRKKNLFSPLNWGVRLSGKHAAGG